MNKYLPQIMLFCGIAFTLCFLAVAGSFYYRSQIGYAGTGRGGQREQIQGRTWSGRMGPMMNRDISNGSGPMGMTMDMMNYNLRGKTGDDLDKAFLEEMIVHHQWALDMVAYLKNSKHPELQKLGEDIVKSQTAEIEQMKKWQKDWGYAK